MDQHIDILIRLPNWLGDMVMSTAFVEAVRVAYPNASIDLIAKKGIDFLSGYFPAHDQLYVFSKEQYKGLPGAIRFGRQIREQKKYTLFFCLPDSFSSAIMGYATGATKRVGFKNQLRSLLLTNAFIKKTGVHRVEEYVDLLEQYLAVPVKIPAVKMIGGANSKENNLLININSEAESRRLPVKKAVSIIDDIRSRIPEKIILIGSPKEKNFVDQVYAELKNKCDIENVAGQTSLPQLVELIGKSKVMLTTDSGPAHVANALGVHSIVLFGAGNEKNTAPYNKINNTVIRLGKLACEPCVKNTCRLYNEPECLVQLDESLITGTVIEALKKTEIKNIGI